MSESGEAGQDLQELSNQLQLLGQVESEIETQIQGAQTRLQEMRQAKSTLEDLQTDSSVQVPVGGDTYVPARVENVDEVIVSIGGDFAAEQTRDDAVDILEERIDLIESGIEDLQETLQDVQEDIQEVQGEAEQLRAQLVQQQRQQAGDLGLGGGGLGQQD